MDRTPTDIAKVLHVISTCQSDYTDKTEEVKTANMLIRQTVNYRDRDEN